MFLQQWGTSWETVVIVLVSAPAAYLVLVAFSRIAGLRSFSQMTNFDLAATVAFGSMLATTIVNSNISLLQGVVAMGALFGAQALMARTRLRSRLERVLDNRPLLLMRHSRMLPQNMRKAKVTENDLVSKLRLAGVTRMDQVDAVVLETTGEVSVLRYNTDGSATDPVLLASVVAGTFGPDLGRSIGDDSRG
ncbi:DUF421 domain-containing protein [Halostreptopolyspora alba]|uniref:DUF421 domain-containing protein n=1 Tax=Halostreptopolyspora alba TaxID=2487137 RepID=A0A3N0EAR2_9ACTN|nr:DUF421 domain-containing protein [Nocardiopsaceae bacterium YIM 96095]